MFEIIILIALIAFLAFVAGLAALKSPELTITSLLILLFVSIIFGYNTIKTETAYALELYQQGKPITHHQSKIVLGHESYSNDKPIVLKKDSQ